ncbi:hypothetical protein [Pseudomonas sp.]|uniref:hypothetical protein n=1 Tax=Pseudomonas sp. TaxID=306 RepID=UPI0019F02BE0|nr:hypothetical protein [Pseudomonas sp.]MBF0674658.1 hypothetical protein [Pseudomonas sp.]
MSRAKVIKKRIFFPHVMYLDTAKHFCEELDRKECISWYDLMACMTTTAFSVEAILNTFGHISIKDFTDFESSTPLVKMRILCEELNIDFDKGRKPFNSIIQILKLRNQFAHPKYKVLSFESAEMPSEKAREIYQQGEILHDLEKALNPELVKRSFGAVKDFELLLKRALGARLPYESSDWRIVINESS